MLKPGDIITLGSYTQDEDVHVQSPIEWKVLDICDGKAFLVSLKAIDYHPYHSESKSTSWKSCSIRQWLNSQFIEKAFSETDVQRIVPTETESGCTDRVFLLSRDEVERYLPDPLAETTEYCNTHGTYIRTKYARYWLRTMGNTPLLALIVGHDGIIFGLGVKLLSAAVRPAMWITMPDNTLE